MKGIMKQTLSIEDYKSIEEVSVVLEVAHLRFWYMNVQPTYLAVYIESANCFLAIDIKDWAHRNYGEAILMHSRLSTNLPALQQGAVPVMFAPLDARSMTCG